MIYMFIQDVFRSGFVHSGYLSLRRLQTSSPGLWPLPGPPHCLWPLPEPPPHGLWPTTQLQQGLWPMRKAQMLLDEWLAMKLHRGLRPTRNTHVLLGG